jgi:hypothetical protein
MSGLVILIGFMFGFTVWRIIWRFVVVGSLDAKRDELQILWRFGVFALVWIAALSAASYATHATYRDGSMILAGIAAAPSFSIAGVVFWIVKRKRSHS